MSDPGDRQSGADLARLDRARFLEMFGTIFEHSPWVAERAFDEGPFGDLDSVHQAMVRAVQKASRSRQIALLRAHPELAGRAARAGTMTDSSKSEQAGAGLNAMSGREVAEIARLNAEYRDRHGFPFIIAVRNHTKAEIFEQIERRLGHDTETEIGKALEQVFAITRLRMRALAPAGDPDRASGR